MKGLISHSFYGLFLFIICTRPGREVPAEVAVTSDYGVNPD